MKRSKAKRWKDKHRELVPIRTASVGMKVFWRHVHYYCGVPEFYWRTGVVEVKQQRRWALVRDRYGHEARVEVKDLFEEGPT